MVMRKHIQSSNVQFSFPIIADARETREGYESVKLGIRHLGDRRLTINTALLEEKSSAVDVLYQLSLVRERSHI